jgi:hypothetical protein
MKWWWISALWLFWACNDNAKPGADNGNDSTTGVHAGATDTIVRSTIGLQDGCYEMIMKRDTATLSLHIQDTTISGDLNYRWAEKDHNKGTIRGYVRDSLLIADYTFESEGLTSVREVVFKLKGDTLLQGVGELTEQNGKIIFKQKDQLQYDKTFPFIKVDCQQLHR